MLHCISSYFNPTNSKKIKENYLTFRKNLKVPLTTVELAFNDQPFFISDSIKIRGDTNNIMWQKERLLNIAIDSCLLYTSPSPRDRQKSRMPSSA